MTGEKEETIKLLEASERDKYLTEAMGECCHEWKYVSDSVAVCRRCNTQYTMRENKNNFSTWDGFGKLWEWCQKQKWWKGTNNPIWCGYTSYRSQGLINIGESFINPDRLADAVYAYLKEIK